MQMSLSTCAPPARYRKTQDAMMARAGIGWSLLLFLLYFIKTGEAIQCYQCDSNEDFSCPSSERFDKEINAPIECNSFEARVPGQFCMKITQESPGWGGWKKVTRRCGSRTDSGVAWGCRWSWDHVGVFHEICYCEFDLCNSSTKSSLNFGLALLSVSMAWLLRKFL